MEAVEAMQGQSVRMPNLIRNMSDLVQAVSVGVFTKGVPGSKAVEFSIGTYRIVAKYENDTEPPPIADIETKRRVFWDKDSMDRLQFLLTGLVDKDRPFITKTGDGSGESPVIILKWEREKVEYARQ